MNTSLLLTFICVLGLVWQLNASKPTYDHQTKTYEAQFKPMRTQGRASITPFFSPDRSLSTIMNWMSQATHTIDISTPGFGSWSGCSSAHSGCAGCKVEDIISNEHFPVFQILNNALHNGIKVRILTNDYNDKLCDGEMNLLTYLQVAGADIHYYTTTSFTHSKYIAVDNDTVLISSINFSKTSIMQNREAGLIIRNNADIYKFTQSVFNYDFEQGYEKKLPTYDPVVIQQIRDASHIPVEHPDPYHYKYCNVTSPATYPITGTMDVTVMVSPDFSYDQVMGDIKATNQELLLSIYQITDDNFCQGLIDLKQAKGDDFSMKLFVSNRIYGKYDQQIALKCYQKLYDAGIVVHMSAKYCLEFSHQKFWILDGQTVYVSTGNWSPSDYPTAPYTFPPYGQSGWRKVNRDYTVKVTNSSGVVKRFSALFYEDYNQAYPFDPSKVKTLY